MLQLLPLASRRSKVTNGLCCLDRVGGVAGLEGPLPPAATKSTSLLNFFSRKPAGAKKEAEESTPGSGAAGGEEDRADAAKDGQTRKKIKKVRPGAHLSPTPLSLSRGTIALSGAALFLVSAVGQVMSDKKLSATTKEARKVETDRRKKLKELQALAAKGTPAHSSPCRSLLPSCHLTIIPRARLG